MTKQRLEAALSKTIKLNPDWYGKKIQNNPLAHTPTDGDFRIYTKIKEVYHIECKECKSLDGKGRFAFDRLTQLIDLLAIDGKFGYISSHLMLSFWKGRLDKSDIFLIPILDFHDYMQACGKKSINNTECNNTFSKFRINVLKGGVLDINGKFVSR